MKHSLFIPLMGFLLFFPFIYSYSQETSIEDSLLTDTDTNLTKDDFIIAALDSLANLKYFEGFECASEEELENVFGFTPGFVPVYADSVYYQRLKVLAASTPIPLTYNRYVKEYIDLYATRKRELTKRVMGLAQIYFPLFEEYLDKYNMPLELKYLAIVESALNPAARSRMGASGLWQFMYGTGKMYKLNVNSLVDDRRDPLRSTIAACEHMTDLYNMYGDWLLVLAAYNSGAGNVNKAIRRSGGKRDFWQIRPFLPLETRNYVPAFIGVTYVMSYTAEHNLRPISPKIHHYEIDTINIRHTVSFKQIAETTGVPFEELQFLNPTFKANVIPATAGNTYALRLPKPYIAAFVDNEAQLFAMGEQDSYEKEQLEILMKSVTQPEYHRVKKGENLGLIARKYKCSVNQLKKWNHLRSTKLSIGQRLIVRPEQEIQLAQLTKAPVKKETPTVADKTSEVDSGDTLSVVAETTTRIENLYHTVKSGENIGSIAIKNNTTVSNIRKWNNIKGSVIHPKQKLIVGKQQITESPVEEIAETKPAAKKNSNSEFIYYTVQSGDTLWTIAQKHEGCSVEEIKKLNNIRNEKAIQPGQKIKVAVAS